MVQSVTADDVTRSYSPTLIDTLFQRVPGVTLSDPNGNNAQQEIRYGRAGELACELESAQRGDTHRYSVSKGIVRLRKAICNWYRMRYEVELDPDREAIVTIGSKEGIAHLALATLDAGDIVLVPNSKTKTIGNAVLKALGMGAAQRGPFIR